MNAPSDSNEPDGATDATVLGNDIDDQQLTLPLALEDGSVPGLFKNAIYACGLFVVLAAAQAPALRVLRAGMVGFVLPLTVLTLVSILVRSGPFLTRAGR